MTALSSVRKVPNFLILGPPKTGTTSLYFYVRQHPQIFMSPAKELTFFQYGGRQPIWGGPQIPLGTRPAQLKSDGLLIDANTADNIWWNANPQTWDEYLSCFAGASPETAIGDATPMNFFNMTACENIRYYLPDARLICILRQPVDRGFSQFQNAVRTGAEPMKDFVAAYRDCARRRQENWHPFLAEYETHGYYVRYLSAYVDRFGWSRVRVYLYDDLRNDPIALLQDIFRYLGVDPTFVPDISRQYNQSLVARNSQVNRLLRRDTTAYRILKRLLPLPLRRKLGGLLRTRAALPPSVRGELTAEYTDEIRELQKMIGRDLSGWLREHA